MKLLEENLKFSASSVDSEKEKHLAQACGISNLCARVLISRGIATKQDAERFLYPDLERDWNDPSVIPGLLDAANILIDAIKANKCILVFGDFDVDGITATCVCVRGLRAFGANVNGLIPHRYTEGYALSDAAIERAVTNFNPELIITVDCGISCAKEVNSLLERGIDVVVTDHHEPGDCVPSSVVVADPKLQKDNPSGDLAGVGVALKLVQVLGQHFNKPDFWKELTEFAAMGTIADLMNLGPENRALVAYGLERLKSTSRPCLIELARVCNIDLQDLTSDRLSFSLIPRINAAGRMGDASVALDLLMSDDTERAAAAAVALESVNNDRKKAEAELLEQVEETLDKEFSGQEAIVVAGEGWHEGVKGIVASRLAKKYKRPTIIFTIEGNVARGSGRSYGNIDLFSIVSLCSELFEKYGGHTAAVGITLKTEYLPLLRDCLCEKLRSQKPVELNVMDADCVVSLSECSIESFLELQRLQPFGHSNPVPLLVLQNVFLEQRSAVGKTGNHFSFRATDGVASMSGIAFGVEDIAKLLDLDGICSLAFEPLVNVWRGKNQGKLFTKKIACESNNENVSSKANAFTNTLMQQSDEICANNKTPIADVQKDIQNLDDTTFEEKKRKLQALSECDLDKYILKALIGERDLREAQAKTLSFLRESKSTLTLMATGRGKSLIFHMHAAKMAISQNKASVFVYPLRALVADQAFHLQNTFENFGLKVCVLTGETLSAERKVYFDALKCGQIDIVLSTPEFVSIHADLFAQTGRIGFFVVDEAHHIALSRAGNRPAYAKLSAALQTLGNPLVLAVTATAADEQARLICQILNIKELVIDSSVRSNMHIEDHRDLTTRNNYVARVVSSGQKCIIYVNSRDKSVELTRFLRKKLPNIAPYISFYNAGLSKSIRKQIEEMFRCGELSCIVSTSAFGEGIDIPDVEHVVIYHIPYNDIEFNQMAGRIGRDGRDAYVHLLFGEHDAKINDQILSNLTPPRKDMVALYKALMQINTQYAQQGENSFCPCAEQLANLAKKFDRSIHLDATAVSAAISVFEELGFLTTTGHGQSMKISMVAAPKLMSLDSSIRYAEGREEIASFSQFKTWVLTSTAKELLERFNRPILPIDPDKVLAWS